MAETTQTGAAMNDPWSEKLTLMLGKWCYFIYSICTILLSYSFGLR